jgi:hypothetical protein
MTRDLLSLLDDLELETKVYVQSSRVPALLREIRLALAAGTQSAETNEDSAQSEGCQSGAKRNAQRTASHD